MAAGVNPTDAVNVSQWGTLQNRVGDIQRIAYSGVAMTGALADLPQVDYGKTFAFGAGIGSYAGYTALAIGTRVNQDTVVEFGVSTTSDTCTLINA